MLNINKKLVLILLISFSFITSIKAQDTLKVETGKICFLRSTGISGSAAAFKTYIDGELVCKLNNKKYSLHEVIIGNHECYVQFGGLKVNEKAEKCKILVEPGKITYVQFFLENGILSFRIYGVEITENKAKEKIKKMKEDTKCL